MAYVRGMDGEWIWEDDSSSGVSTPVQSSISANNVDAGDTASYTPGSQEQTGALPSVDTSWFWRTAAETGAFGSESSLASFVKPIDANNIDRGDSGNFTSGSPAETKGFFDKLKDGISKAYDKDPMKALELGFGTLAGLYKTSEARKLQQSQAQAALDQLAAKAQVEKDSQDRYTASLGGGGPRSNTKKPLTRQDGSRVYNTNGTLNRG